IWGSSPSDVWCVGPGGDKDKTIYHFNGQKWVNDGISRPLSPRTVFGFSQNNVWFGSYGNTIWHYDGNNISRFQDYTIPNYSWAGIENIWGDSPNNVYAVGWADSSNVLRGVIQHFDGSNWEMIYMSKVDEDFVKIYRGISSGDDYYILSFRNNENNNNHTDSTLIYQFDGKNLKEVYSFPAQIKIDITVISSEIYFIFEDKIYILERSTSNLENKLDFLTNISNNSFWGGSWGRSRNDVFLGMKDGIAHFNGTDIQYLFHFNDFQIGIGGAAIFDKEVFFLAYDFQSKLNLIIRGKLN
ncbi:MAG: hypothetical protein ACYCVH_07790, partial [Ignavibacteriaceae bacterium]